MKKKAGKGRVKLPAIIIAMLLLVFGLVLLCAKLILSGVIEEKRIGLCAGVIAGIVAMLIAMCIARRSPRHKLLWGITAAAGYYLLLMVCNLLFFGNGFSEMIPTAAWVLGSGLLGTLLGSKKVRKYA